jgi:hypothetical protein
MLLFVKKRFADQLRAGTKTIEIRVGSRYKSLVAGSCLSINGHFRMIVLKREELPLRSLVHGLKGREHLTGHSSAADLRRTLLDCYPNGLPDEPCFLLHVSVPPTG